MSKQKKEYASYVDFIAVVEKYKISSKNDYCLLRLEHPEEFAVFPYSPMNVYEEFEGFSKFFNNGVAKCYIKKDRYSYDEFLEYLKENGIDNTAKYCAHRTRTGNYKLPQRDTIKKLYPAFKWPSENGFVQRSIVGKMMMPKDVFDVLVSAHSIKDVDDLNDFIMSYNNNPKSNYKIAFDVEKEYGYKI